jgi:hypothetical protein
MDEKPATIDAGNPDHHGTGFRASSATSGGKRKLFGPHEL